MLRIGIDVGGTKIAAIAITEKGESLAEALRPTPTEYPALRLVLRELVREVAGGQAVSHVGVGVPGAIRRDNGFVRASNVPCLSGRSVAQDLGEFLGFPVLLGNDADCFALSEARDGAARGYENVFGLILGTGVGGGLVMHGRGVQGAHGLAGEWGHLPLPWRQAEDGPEAQCGCGRFGCIDQTLNAAGLLRIYAQEGVQAADSKEISKKALEGDVIALKTLDRYFDMLARALVIPLQLLDPDVIVVGGGLSDLPGLYEQVPLRWMKYAYAPPSETKFVKAKWGARSGLRGAAWLD